MRQKPWNGTRIKKKQNTIEERLKQYCFLLFTFNIVVCVFMFLIIGIYAKTYNRMMNSTYWLEELYSEFNRMHTATVEYAFSEKENWMERFEESLEITENDLRELKKLNIAGNYQRNLTDLEHLLQNYQKRRQSVIEIAEHSDPESGQSIPGYKESYNALREVYVAIMNKKEVVYNELHLHFNQQNFGMRRKLWYLVCAIVCELMLGFLIVWLNARKLSGRITLPLQKLTKKAEQIEENNLDEMDPEIPKDIENEDPVIEVEVLNAAFHTMLKKIQRQVAELKETMTVREQLKEQEMENLRVLNLLTLSELHCLQMQMNPHFLFNTLNMIQQNVYLDKKEKTSFLLKETAAFLRYSLDYVGKNVSLQVELEALGNYISLQEERMGERILFEFDLDETFNNMKIPSLILQPLVENSLIHGVGDKREGALVRICTEYQEEEKCGCIRIEDNGHGMSSERLAEIRRDMESEELMMEKSIGLSNVYKRLQLFTEGTAVMEIESEPEQGTTVTIKIRYLRDGDKNGESIDCG
ncbi:MAG: histidine kinase [Lachnospiraceae bacterium]|nr:histidine kinase [Robinsoniella sp.]MDY3767333.1 histidine kinase [Lachnospiraceae bacterium]